MVPWRAEGPLVDKTEFFASAQAFDPTSILLMHTPDPPTV
jgi:hypothetical protein